MGTDFSKIFNEWEKNNEIINKDSVLSKENNNIDISKFEKEKPLTLDLHGMTKANALEELKNFIEKHQTGYPVKVIIIHGVGRHSDGKRVLKESVKEWLSRNKKYIRNFRPAGIGEGSGGATVAYINSK
jgi:DNA-nicking Smr family endonuclease